jgi:ATP-dependent Lhr-like helicase
VPNEFFPHHGSLSKEVREDAEARLKDKRLPVSLVCTSTLELGLDVGDIKAVAQVEPPPSVTSLRQRLGRAGRRDEPAILRLYVSEEALHARSQPADALRLGLVETIAMVELLIEKWCEPPTAGAMHLSTLVHQVLSTIVQHGGIRAAQLWRALCETGPFREVDQARFAALLRGLAAHDLIVQTDDGALVTGLAGERLVNHYGFYAVFATSTEYQLVTAGRRLGTLPIGHALTEGSYLTFAGRRWRVVAVDTAAKRIELKPAGTGQVLAFRSRGALGNRGSFVHDKIRERMRELYLSERSPTYLDGNAASMLTEARQTFAKLGLRERALVAIADDTALFPWCGDRALDTVALALQVRGQRVMRHDASLLILGRDPGTVRAALLALDQSGLPSLIELGRMVRAREREKFHPFLPDELLREDFVSSRLDKEGARQVIARLAHAP